MTTDRLYKLQLPDGSFESVVTSRRGRVADRNGFTAALVLRATRHVPADAVLSEVRRRALSFLLSCASKSVLHAFAFWPDTTRPPWASLLPPDVDDTAIMVTELHRYCWIDATDALRHVCHAMIPHRVSDANAANVPSWVVPGCFYTWIVPLPSSGVETSSANLVDCCVNANAVALMAMIGAQHLPGYTAAVQTIINAVSWAGSDRRKILSVTPFYPSVATFVEALEHAVECGATALREVLCQLHGLELDPYDQVTGCCCSAYGATVWHCEAVNVARALPITVM